MCQLVIDAVDIYSGHSYARKTTPNTTTTTTAAASHYLWTHNTRIHT